MGGVDLANMLMSLYRIDIRSKRYYNRIIYYFLGVCMVNAWNMFKWNTSRNMPLKEFTILVSMSLMREGIKKKVVDQTINFSKNRTKIPEGLRFDGYHHFPVINKTRNRCNSCKNLNTFISCSKCNTFLCINPGKMLEIALLIIMMSRCRKHKHSFTI